MSQLTVQFANCLQQLAYYRGILEERSELRRLQAELQTTKDNAEATRQYHLTSVNHLEEKSKVTFNQASLCKY